ncbi:hypothetical protein B0F90DRAFT_1666351 [Multifurca ochricompacta]|uniref:Uncharacterized protein n=1 Tax=Multifurca ochricompacta TaxID=376703 RepID=A0AAD4M9D2_9AGAM|nr:hypothetical protein B0F90DRAFT_1666351 [Multifurca ochricompacta]
MSSILAVPSSIWNWYIHYLWNYDNNSWVATIAYGFRIWAILAILPTLILGLLDVTSYVIARTLGDPTASTSHKSSFATVLSKSESESNDATLAASPTEEKLILAASPVAVDPKIQIPATPTRSPTFFVDGDCDDDGAARLSGVGVFSPIASAPGSPTASRRNFLEDSEKEERQGSTSDSETGSARDVPCEDGHSNEHSLSGSLVTGGSTSGESSFALLDREESFEDAGAHIRRRVLGTTGADD